MNRFYVDFPLELNQIIILPDNVYHHWIRVLRANMGDFSTLFNGSGGEFRAKLVAIDKKNASVQLIKFDPINRTPQNNTTLGLVMSKGERMTVSIQKATELGVSAIQLLVSERCEMRLKYDRDQKKIAYWQQIAISACEQCGMNLVPKVLEPMALVDWVTQSSAALKLVTTPEVTGDAVFTPATVASLQGKPLDILLLVGPEGGLTAAEIELAQTHGFLSWQLGARIIRTETAPLVALSVLNYLFN